MEKLLRFEVVSVVNGMTTTWEVEANGMADARRIAKERMRQSWTTGQIVSVCPLGYKPKKDT